MNTTKQCITVAPDQPPFWFLRISDPDSYAAAKEGNLWARLWPVSRLLLQLIHELGQNESLQDTNFILDIGCGMGLSTCYAALTWPRATRVVGVDIVDLALQMGSMNADLHQIQDRVQFCDYNWHRPVPAEWAGTMDLIVASDVIYFTNALAPLARLVQTCLSSSEPGALAIFADPGRGNHEAFVERLLEHDLEACWFRLDQPTPELERSYIVFAWKKHKGHSRALELEEMVQKIQVRS
ncbi:hypothetical protein HDV03_001022 [Kappamyces sp. JEL0829]|nr:hypothetical protein HDV03_001022 [Kappamyces sp. JEL0829]